MDTGEAGRQAVTLGKAMFGSDHLATANRWSAVASSGRILAAPRVTSTWLSALSIT